MTFDTGGISIKPASGMSLMRGDMGGAACAVSSLIALAQLECQKRVVALVPLCENMPSGNAVKPGDVVTAMNGKTIEVAIFKIIIVIELVQVWSIEWEGNGVYYIGWNSNRGVLYRMGGG